MTATCVFKPAFVEGYQGVSWTDAQGQAMLDDDPAHQTRTWSVHELSLVKWEGRYRSLRRSDFPYFGSSIPLFSGRAREALEPLMTGAVEFRPVNCEGEIYFAVLDVLRVGCLDEDASEIEWFPGQEGRRAMEIKRYVFRCEQLLGHHIFALPQLFRSPMFVDETYVQRVKEAGLEGLDFTLLWSSTLDSEVGRDS